MRSVRKKDNFKLAAFLRSTILGLLVVSACFGAALRYMTEFYASPLPVSSVKNTGVIVENTAEIQQITAKRPELLMKILKVWLLIIQIQNGKISVCKHSFRRRIETSA